MFQPQLGTTTITTSFIYECFFSRMPNQQHGFNVARCAGVESVCSWNDGVAASYEAILLQWHHILSFTRGLQLADYYLSAALAIQMILISLHSIDEPTMA